MITLYHNPRCTKSRQAKEYLENKNIDFKIREYLKDPLSEGELKELLKKLNRNPIDLVRKNEAFWKENYKGKDLSDDEIIQAMLKEPKLIERPIIENKNKAVVGRPTEKIDEVI